ncbi:MAG: hypothetical protein Q4G50_05240 [Corynebacterium sp.]|uniref:hypothetical protein n=1 Tax=Corynebacterium sp. TaxID=1720 RepID=UPI0026E0B23F|nr:hypothetical protein [Corynebacterium sp.]MDO5669387.1 hypothetical protein [Corynebacterium sp.]
MDTRRLTGPIALRLWAVVVVVGAAGAGLLWLGVGLGMALVTIAVLSAPLALVTTVAWIARRPAVAVPRWLLWLGAMGSVLGLVWLLVSPGEVPAILVLAIGVWLAVVGLISSVAVGVAGR